MIYLKLEKNKQLRVIQSAPLYQGENRADAIKVSLEDEYTPKDYICYLHLLSKDADNKGDFVSVSNGEEYYLDNRFLTEDLNSICVWLELRKEEDIVKTNPIEIIVNKHYNIEEIIEDTDISAFEKLLQETTVLYADILKTKEEIEELVKDIEGDTIREELNSKAPLENPNFKGKVLVNDEEVLTESNVHTVAKTGDYNDLTNKPAVDSNYVPSSSNAQSGIAVSEAIKEVVGNPPLDLNTIELVAKSLSDSQKTIEEMEKQLDNKIEESDLSDYASKQDVHKIEDTIASIGSGEVLVGRAHKDVLNRKIDETYATIEAIINIQNGVTTVGKSQIAQKAVKDNLGRTIDTTYATSGDVQAAIAKLVDSAPEALNTLEELAAALGNDENFSTTVMTEIGKKASNETVQNLSDTVEDILEGEVSVKRSEKATYDEEGFKLARNDDVQRLMKLISTVSNGGIDNILYPGLYINEQAQYLLIVLSDDMGNFSQIKIKTNGYREVRFKSENTAWSDWEKEETILSNFVQTSLTGYEKLVNKISVIPNEALEEDVFYPSAKAVQEYISALKEEIETLYLQKNQIATNDIAGVVKVFDGTHSSYGVKINSNGKLQVDCAYGEEIKAKASQNSPITPAYADVVVNAATHQTMSDDYDVSTLVLCASENGKQSQYPASYNATKEYVDNKIGDIETSLDNIIIKYGLGGEAL